MDNTPLITNGNLGSTYDIDASIEMERSSSGNSTSFNFSDRRKTTVTTDTLGVGETDADKSNANGVNIIFWKRIYSIIQIGYNSSPVSRLALETYVLIVLKIILNWLTFFLTTNGEAEVLPPLFQCKLQNYNSLVFKFAVLVAISSIGGSILKYLSSMIRLRLRTKVTRTLHNMLHITV